MKIPNCPNQNPYIEEEQTTQWPKEKVQKDKQRSTKHTYKTEDRVTRTALKTGSTILLMSLTQRITTMPDTRVGILLTCGKHLPEHNIEPRERVGQHRTSFSPVTLLL